MPDSVGRSTAVACGVRLPDGGRRVKGEPPVGLSIGSDATDPSVLRLVVSGEVDLASVGDLTTEVTRAIADGWRSIVVDLDAVTFLDSTGIGGLISGRQLADTHGAAFRVTNARDRVRWILDTSGVWAYLAGEGADRDT